MPAPGLNIYFFPNGHTSVTNDKGQVEYLQLPWFLMYLSFLEREGVDPCACRFHLPDGRRAVVARTTNNSYGWEVTS